MIPKIIHYCWFGKGPMPPLAQKCIDSWLKFLPDYKLILWNEDNFDVNAVPYVKEAYESRKYAFVTDYIRLWALKNYGGIYMDTDVEVLKSFDDLLNLTAFTGYEGSQSMSPVTGLMASQAAGQWVKEQLHYYDERHFIKEDGTFDLTSNTVIIKSIMLSNGFVNDGKYTVYKDMHVFPVDYFCPKNSRGIIKLTKNSYCIHHFAASWFKPTFFMKLKILVRRIVGPRTTEFIVALKSRLNTFRK